MKRFPQLCLFLFFSLSAFALEEGHARYVGGTVPGLTSGVIGRLDTTSTTSLTFARAGNKVEIPYASIESYEYSKDVTPHRGGAVRDRGRAGQDAPTQPLLQHLLPHRSPGRLAQIVVLEVPKDMPRSLQAILQTRAPQAGCNRKNAQAPLRSTAATDDHPPLPIQAP
jgi:hypothetical protein